VALDTNVLVYAEGLNEKTKRDAALEITRKLRPESTVLPVLLA
jgi:predicted nucleic acid-binding protein